MKSTWNCSLVFGDLVIPVKLYSATKQSHLEFEMVDSRDLGKICFSHFNHTIGEIVSEKSDRIEFNQFVPFSSIPVMSFDGFYYLLPGTDAIDRVSAKDYAVVLHHLQSLSICGISQSYFRNLSTLFVLSSFEGKIILHKNRFQSNFVAADTPVLPALTDADLDKESYIHSFFNNHLIPFDPNLFKDSFSESLLSAIQHPSVSISP